jgi:hypothetical protein
MAVFNDIARFVVRLSPEPACDDCIADRLGLAAHQRPERETTELAGSNGFTRSRAACSLCGETRTVIAKD